MKKYYTFTFYMWLVLAALSLGIAIWKYLEIGDAAWWFFVVCAVALFMCYRRYVALKNARPGEKDGPASKN